MLAIGLSILAAALPTGQSEQIVFDGGRVAFYARGNRLYAKDTRKDGYAVRADLKWDDVGGAHRVGIVDRSSAGAGKSFAWDISENITVHIRGCYVQGEDAKQCSGWQDAAS